MKTRPSFYVPATGQRTLKLGTHFGIIAGHREMVKDEMKTGLHPALTTRPVL